MLQNASVIQIDNNELKSKTLHPDNSGLPSSTKISQTNVMKLSICLFLINYLITIKLPLYLSIIFIDNS